MFANQVLTTPSSFRPEHVFAVVIGIDKYEDGYAAFTPNRLYGCEKDAINIWEYLVNTLQVPPGNVQLLVNNWATRKNILDSIDSHFMKNPNIWEGDCMILYFAGHGGREDAPSDWASEDGKVETICPYDTATQRSIPDRTLSALLHVVAAEKGNNIIAIFDSCHSGGMGRIPERTRLYQPQGLHVFPADQDKHIWFKLEIEGHLLKAGMHRAMESFVLLAACQPNEYARENCAGGFFTTELVNTLKSRRDPSSLTYRALIHEALRQLDQQNPYCEGKNRVRRLFSPSDDGADLLDTFMVKPTGDLTWRYRVEAGKINGVLEGTEFKTVPPGGYTPITLVAETVAAFCSFVVLKGPAINPLPQHSRVKISNRNWLKVKLVPRKVFQGVIEMEDSLFTIVELGERLKPGGVQVSWGGAETAHVIRTDPLMENLPLSLPLTKVTTPFLNRVAHFHFFLYHNHESNPDHSKVLSVSLQRLQKEGAFFEESMFPAGDNLFQPSWSNEKDPVVAEAELNPQNDVYYGLTLTNNWGRNLFPYVFYFNPDGYVINKLYLPHSGQGAPLKPGGSPVTIGYGAFGTDPFKFTLPPGVNSDSGFIKVFVSTSYVNMEHVEWPEGRPNLEYEDPRMRPVWGAWTYRIKVRRNLRPYSLASHVFPLPRV